MVMLDIDSFAQNLLDIEKLAVGLNGIYMKKLEQAEMAHADEYESPEHPPQDIVVFNELRSCADLYRLVDTEQLEIQPYFQREDVWSDADQTRFIDSLVKQLPIPSLCLGFDFQMRKWIVIDGLQRMTAMIRFLAPDSKWVLSNLKDIDKSLAGVSVAALRKPESPLRMHFERVENMTLPITVIRCNFKDYTHTEYLFKIFHRLNAGGMKLTNQEIRNCIYSGPFNKLLRELDTTPEWVSIKSYVTGKKDRFRAVELILRMFAFLEDRVSYGSNLPRFLNGYMQKNRFANQAKMDGYSNVFIGTTATILNMGGIVLADRRLGFSQIEALLIGVATNLDAVKNMTADDFVLRINKFMNIGSLSSEELRNDISSKERVNRRIEDSIAVFS